VPVGHNLLEGIILCPMGTEPSNFLMAASDGARLGKCPMRPHFDVAELAGLSTLQELVTILFGFGLALWRHWRSECLRSEGGGHQGQTEATGQLRRAGVQARGTDRGRG